MNTMELFKELKYYKVKDALREKADTVNDPEITKYNNYEEVSK